MSERREASIKLWSSHRARGVKATLLAASLLSGCANPQKDARLDAERRAQNFVQSGKVYSDCALGAATTSAAGVPVSLDQLRTLAESQRVKIKLCTGAAASPAIAETAGRKTGAAYAPLAPVTRRQLFASGYTSTLGTGVIPSSLAGPGGYLVYRRNETVDANSAPFPGFVTEFLVFDSGRSPAGHMDQRIACAAHAGDVSTFSRLAPNYILAAGDWSDLPSFLREKQQWAEESPSSRLAKINDVFDRQLAARLIAESEQNRTILRSYRTVRAATEVVSKITRGRPAQEARQFYDALSSEARTTIEEVKANGPGIGSWSSRFPADWFLYKGLQSWQRDDALICGLWYPNLLRQGLALPRGPINVGYWSAY